MKKSIVLLLLTKLCLAITLSATPISAEQLQQQVDSLISLQHGPGQPGGALLVVHAGKPLYSRTFGLMNLEQETPVDANTLFDLASVAKQFTAYGIWLLEKEGKLNLEDDIRRYLPQLPQYEYAITLRNLLQHTSGIASTDWLRLLSGMSLDEVWYQEDEYEIIRKYPWLNFEPNTSHVYSNAGYSLLAQIIESVSGMSFPQYAQQEIFDPLAMEHTFIQYSPEVHTSMMAIGYGKVGDEFTDITSADEYSYGGGNIHSSLSNITNWVACLQNPNSPCNAFYKEASQAHNTLQNGDTIHYTYGFFVRKHRGIKLVEHSGGVPGFRNILMLFPEHDLGIVVMSNNETIRTRGLAMEVAGILLADHMQDASPVARVEKDISPALIKSYQGTYGMPDGMELQFVAEKDTFWLVLPDESRFQLFAESNNKFFLKAFDAQCTFVLDPRGEVNQMTWHQRGSNVMAMRVEESIPVTVEDLQAFAGAYHHPALKAAYPVTMEDETLVLHLPEVFNKYLGFSTSTLSHINGDKFLTERLGIMEFIRDDNKEINGFILRDIGRMQNVKFARE